MGIPGVKIKKDDILDAIIQKGPVINHIAKFLNCSRQAIYEWKDKDIDVKNALEKSRSDYEIIRNDIHTELKFKAYQSSLCLLDQMDVPTTIFILKTLCGLEQRDSGVNFTINDKGTMDAKK